MRVSRAHFQRRNARFGPQPSRTLWVKFAGKLGTLWAPRPFGSSPTAARDHREVRGRDLVDVKEILEPRRLLRGAHRSASAESQVGCRADLSSWAECGGPLPTKPGGS